MAKSPGIQVEPATGGEGKKNELYVPRSMIPPKWEAQIWGEGGKLVKNYHDLSPKTEVNRVTIIFSFDNQKGKYQEDEKEDNVVYRFVNPNYQSQAELEEMETEALTDFLIHQADSLLGTPQNHQNELKITLKKAVNQIELEVSSGNRKTTIKSQNIKLEGRFYLKEAFKLREVKPPRPLKPRWWKTIQGKIIILTVVGAIILLVVIFRKKIWSWIKGGKKKPKETIIL